MRLRTSVASILIALFTGACGSDDGEAPEPVERKDETAGKLPKLERGWIEHANTDAGIAFGRPPGWAANDKGAVTTLTAPDELVSATITVDRTDDALGGDPKVFATETIELLRGYRKPLESGKPKPFRHQYQGAIAEAEGVAKQSGLRQRARVIVLERNGVAVVTAVIAENAERKAASSEAKQAQDAIETLRTRPPG